MKNCKHSMCIVECFKSFLLAIYVFLPPNWLLFFIQGSEYVYDGPLSFPSKSTKSKSPSNFATLYMHRVVNTHHKKKKTESHGGIFVREKDGSMRIKEDVEKDKRSRACTPRSSRKILNQSSWPVSRAVNGYTLSARCTNCHAFNYCPICSGEGH